MSQRLTTEEFISKSIKIHGEKYDYSKCKYVNNRTKVCIICKKHGAFYQTPTNHLKGYGCKLCVKENSIGEKIIFKHGINDYMGKIRINKKLIESYSHWYKMIERCYSEEKNKIFPTYADCSVCSSWMLFSNFKIWFDKNYIKGYELDKDILIKGNKVYSPSTCCFVPKSINSMFKTNKNNRGKYPIGVFPKGEKFQSYVQKCCKIPHYIGTFSSTNDAFNAYKYEKEKYIKEIANKYYIENKISYKVYNSMCNYKVEITD